MFRRFILILHLIALSTGVVMADSWGDNNITILDELPASVLEQEQEQEQLSLGGRIKSTFDRGINRNPYVYKGEFVVGLTATHANINASNSEILLLLNDISAGGYYTSINPYVGYAINDNKVLGARFGFTRMGGNIDTATIDLGEDNDVSFDLPYISYTSDTFSYGVFFRSYAGLDTRGRFALFADVDLSYKRSNSLFEMDMGGEPLFTRSQSWGIDLDFNPGIGVYVLSNVSATLSFGLGGLSYGSATQYDRDDLFVGDFEDSKLSLKFNILAIKIGINIHLWSNE